MNIRTRDTREYRENNPIAYRAHKIVYAGLRKGDVLKPKTCDHCGDKGRRLEAHHNDYCRPLLVEFICGFCHGGWHKILGRGLNG